MDFGTLIGQGSLLFMAIINVGNAIIYFRLFVVRPKSNVRIFRLVAAALSVVLVVIYGGLFLGLEPFVSHTASGLVRGPFMFLLSITALFGLALLANPLGSE